MLRASSVEQNWPDDNAQQPIPNMLKSIIECCRKFVQNVARQMSRPGVQLKRRIKAKGVISAGGVVARGGLDFQVEYKTDGDTLQER